MNDQIILRFLRAGLINVGGDDAKLERLQETATDLAAALKNTPAKAASFALIAFDPEAPVEDPVIKGAIEALEKRWATYVNTFSGTPVAVLRAVLLDAVLQASSDNDKIGVAFVSAARNALPFTEAGAERKIWAEIVAEVEQRIDARAEAEWATPDTISVPAMTFNPPAAIEITTPKSSFDEAALAKKLQAAAGPQSPAGPTGGNPSWPSNNAPWVGEFGTRLAAVFKESLDAVAEGSKIKPIDLSGPLKELAQAVSSHVDGTLKAVSGATAGLQRRTNMIWWKETLYSPSARVSYRTMSASTAAALMAFDLHKQVPTFSPASVAAFLHETVLSLPAIDADASLSIRDLLKEASNSNALNPLREAAGMLFPEQIGRGPLLGLIGQGIDGSQLDENAFRNRVGVPSTTTLKVPEWAMWIFRELQGARAVQEGTDVKKRGRKS